MRISEVCAKVHLTERAVRLYIREGLVQTGQRNGITVFDEAGIARLGQIAVLRRADFSIPQIRRMLESPETVGAVIDEKIGQLRQSIGEEQAMLSVLLSLKSAGSVEGLVQHIRRSESPEAAPIHTSFDEPRPTDADIQRAWNEIEAAERRKARHRKLLPVYIAAALAVLIALIALEHKMDEYAEANSAAFSAPHLQQKLREILEIQDAQNNAP